MQYQRSETSSSSAAALPRARGDSIDIWPAYEKYAVHVELFGDEVDRIDLINPTSAARCSQKRTTSTSSLPCTTSPPRRRSSAHRVRRASAPSSTSASCRASRHDGKLLEAQRLLVTHQDTTSRCSKRSGSCSGRRELLALDFDQSPGRASAPFTLLGLLRLRPARRERHDRTRRPKPIQEQRRDERSTGPRFTTRRPGSEQGRLAHASSTRAM